MRYFDNSKYDNPHNNYNINHNNIKIMYTFICIFN